ncbi:MAG TPA: hypothetical protein P5287_05545, partial [bacterium]|nr:hypothetical protein [bacterium]
DGLQNILPHELAHLCVADIAGGGGGKGVGSHPVPLCLNEGIAERFVTLREQRNIKALCYRAIKRDRFVSLSTLLAVDGYPANTVELAILYCQSYSLVDFILNQRGGKKKLIAYLSRAGRSRGSPRQLFEEFYFDRRSHAEFEAAWKRYVVSDYEKAAQTVFAKKRRAAPAHGARAARTRQRR